MSDQKINVVAFLPEIINFAKAFFTGKDAVSAMMLNLKNLNEVTKAANKMLQQR